MCLRGCAGAFACAFLCVRVLCVRVRVRVCVRVLGVCVCAPQVMRTAYAVTAGLALVVCVCVKDVCV